MSPIVKGKIMSELFTDDVCDPKNQPMELWSDIREFDFAESVRVVDSKHPQFGECGTIAGCKRDESDNRHWQVRYAPETTDDDSDECDWFRGDQLESV